MTKTIDIAQTDASVAELVTMARDGSDVVLSEDGKPLARIVPIH